MQVVGTNYMNELIYAGYRYKLDEWTYLCRFSVQARWMNLPMQVVGTSNMNEPTYAGCQY
jgi:hypothetical protein